MIVASYDGTAEVVQQELERVRRRRLDGWDSALAQGRRAARKEKRACQRVCRLRAQRNKAAAAYISVAPFVDQALHRVVSLPYGMGSAAMVM